jgi:transcriptional regulator with XRE-family HTH domain
MAMDDFASRLKSLMREQSIGVRALARISGYSPTYISQLRLGQRNPSPEAARDLDQALKAAGQLSAFAPEPAGTAVAVAHAGDITAILASIPDPGPTGIVRDDDYDQLIQHLSDWAARMRRRDLLAVLSAAAAAAYASPAFAPDPDGARRTVLAASGQGRADETVVAHMNSILTHLMRQEDTLGPQIVLGTVLAQRDVAQTLLASGPDEPVRGQLLALLANIYRFAGWSLFNLNDYRGAEHFYGQARAAAHEADDDALCSMVLANWSHLATWAGDPRLGVEHALGAAAWAQRAGSPMLLSYACDVGARAYAAVIRKSSRGNRTSDHAHVMTSLDQAWRELSGATADDPGAGLVYFYGNGMHLSTRTDCLLALGDPEPALALARQSLAVLPVQFPRNIALTRVHSAHAHLQMGHVDAACADLAVAATLTRGNTSARLAAVITGTRKELVPWNGSRPVAQLDEHLVECRVTVLRDAVEQEDVELGERRRRLHRAVSDAPPPPVGVDLLGGDGFRLDRQGGAFCAGGAEQLVVDGPADPVPAVLRKYPVVDDGEGPLPGLAGQFVADRLVQPLPPGRAGGQHVAVPEPDELAVLVVDLAGGEPEAGPFGHLREVGPLPGELFWGAVERRLSEYRLVQAAHHVGEATRRRAVPCPHRHASTLAGGPAPGCRRTSRSEAHRGLPTGAR